MDFEYIFDTYPKAYMSLYEWVDKNRKYIEESMIYKFSKSPIAYYYLPSGYRWLYDFFEYQNLSLNLSQFDDGDFTVQILEKDNNWHMNLIYNGVDSHKIFPTRKDAEKFGFLEMFERIEFRLKFKET